MSEQAVSIETMRTLLHVYAVEPRYHADLLSGERSLTLPDGSYVVVGDQTAAHS